MLYYKDTKLGRKKKEKIVRSIISKYLKRTTKALVVSEPIVEYGRYTRG